MQRKTETQIPKPFLIHHFLEESARLYPDKVALVQGDVRLTYEEINSKANQFASWLVDQGVSPGDRITLILKNSPEYVISYYALLKAGAVAVPLSTDISAEALGRTIEEVGPSVLISSRRFERVLKIANRGIFKRLKLVIQNPSSLLRGDAPRVFDYEQVSLSKDDSDLKVPRDPSQLSSIIYTSGSTGVPKGVMLSHGNIVSNTLSICDYLNLTHADVQLVVLPFFYVMGKSLLNSHFAVGGGVVINNTFAYPASVVKQMVEDKITGFSGVPSTYAHLAYRSPLAANRERLSHLRYCSQAGGHMPHHLKMELMRILPDHCRIIVMYGATEASARLAYLDPDELRSRVNSIGKPIPGVTLTILGKNGRVLPPGESGEIAGQGPNIMMGYWKDPEGTAKVLGPHGYRTGDLGYRDVDGYYYVTGRNDNLLKVGGHRINTQEIEDALMATGMVLQSAVVGLPDDLLGNRLTALIVTRQETVDARQVMAACADILPKFKRPHEILSVRALPLKASGKVDRDKCLQMARKDP